MKKKIIVLLVSISLSLCALYTGFGEWHDKIETKISITAANLPNENGKSSEVDQKSVTTDNSSPENKKPQDGNPKITITQQIDELNKFNSDSSWIPIN